MIFLLSTNSLTNQRNLLKKGKDCLLTFVKKEQ